MDLWEEQTIKGPWSKPHGALEKDENLNKENMQLIPDLAKKLKERLDSNPSFEFIDYWHGCKDFRRISKKYDPEEETYQVHLGYAYAENPEKPLEEDGSIGRLVSQDSEYGPWGNVDYSDNLSLTSIEYVLRRFHEKDGNLLALKRFLDSF